MQRLLLSLHGANSSAFSPRIFPEHWSPDLCDLRRASFRSSRVRELVTYANLLKFHTREFF